MNYSFLNQGVGSFTTSGFTMSWQIEYDIWAYLSFASNLMSFLPCEYVTYIAESKFGTASVDSVHVRFQLELNPSFVEEDQGQSYKLGPLRQCSETRCSEWTEALRLRSSLLT